MGEEAESTNRSSDPAWLSESEVSVSNLTDNETIELEPEARCSGAPATVVLPPELHGKPVISLHRPHLGEADVPASELNTDQTWLSSDSIPGYFITGMLGRGGMGEVFLAKHIQLQRDVALKVLARPSALTRRFEREMALAGKLEHAHIVKTFDAGCFGQFSYLAMEHIVGCNLAQLVASRGPLPTDIVREILRQALRAMVHIHELGIVHRDIKPANFMLSTDGCVKMLDLGLAKQELVDEKVAANQTVTQHLLGTAAYAAPEQGFDTRAVGSPSDIYALGCMAYFLLTGTHPYQGATAVETFVMHRDAPIPNVARVRPSVDERLAACIIDMMSKSPAERPTATELLQRCEQYPEVSLAGVAIATPPATLFPDSDFEKTAFLQFPDESRRDIRRSARKWLALCALLPALSWLVFTLWPGNGNRYGVDPGASDRVVQVTALGNVNVLHVLSPLQAALISKRPDLEGTLRQLPSGVNANDSRIQSLLSLMGEEGTVDNRTAIIHWLPAFAPLNTVAECMRASETASIRAACVQMLGVYEPQGAEMLAAFESQKSALYEELTNLYLMDPDPEVHSSLQWLATRWNWTRRWNALVPYLQQRTIPFEGGWYQPLVAPTMVVIPGPRDAELGSLVTEAGQDEQLAQDERPRTVHIPRTFAISTVEVSKLLMWRASSDHWNSPQPADGQLPVSAIQWFEAAELCNELSRLEGLPRSEFCYEVKRIGDRFEIREYPDALERTGYRLPTDDEWEIACRAGSTSIRPHGDEIGWLPEYANCWNSDDEDQRLEPVGILKPNQFGMFDMLGNISEWTNDLVYVEEERRRRLRGGSVWTPHEGMRSSARYFIAERLAKPHERTGIRVARTIRQEPLPLPTGVNLYVEAPRPNSETPNDLPADLQTDPATKPSHFQFLEVTHQQPLSLGTWHTGKVPVRHFRLSNTGTDEIQIAPVEQSNFTLDPPPASVLLPGMSTEFGLRCNENFIGERVSEFILNVGGESPSQLKLQIPVCLEGAKLVIDDLGEFSAGELNVDLGNIPLGSRIGREFRLSNQGNLQTTARVIDVEGDCELSRNALQSLEPGASDWFHVAMRADQVGECTGVVKLHSSEGDGQSLVINLRAHAVENGKFKLPGYYRRGKWLFNHNGDGKSMDRVNFGDPIGIPLTGDWNGDGHTDLAVCRRDADGHWHWSLLNRNSDNQDSKPTEFTWGEEDDRPVVADVNGDGRTDLGLVRTTPSSRPDQFAEFKATFDTDGDRTTDTERLLRWDSRLVTTVDEIMVLSGDFDGDCIDELVLTRSTDPNLTSLRRWRIHYADGRILKSTFGLNSQTPVVGDWNGDGGADLGTSAEVHRNLVFYFNYDDDQYAEADLRTSANAEGMPIAARK